MTPVISVGTIVAYGGSFSADDVANLKALGWLPCDGSSFKKIDYPLLALAIGSAYGGAGGLHGNFNVPDLRGRFLRGTTWSGGNDPDAASRVASNPGGGTGNLVGSLQAAATGRPEVPFTTSSDGLHAHNVPHAPIAKNGSTVAGGHYSQWNDGAITVGVAGDHAHTVATGFDAESRPINTYVNFIISYLQPQSS